MVHAKGSRWSLYGLYRPYNRNYHVYSRVGQIININIVDFLST